MSQDARILLTTYLDMSRLNIIRQTKAKKTTISSLTLDHAGPRDVDIVEVATASNLDQTIQKVITCLHSDK